MTHVWNLGKSRYGTGALAIVLVFSAAACAPQDQSAEFAAVVGGWQAAYDTKDLDALAAVYTEDCVLMPPNAELGTGRAFARDAFGGMIEAGLTSKTETIFATAAGGVGYHAGKYTMYAPDGSVADRGKFIEGFTKVDGEWKIAHDIFNSDLAPGAGTTSLTITHNVKDGDHWLAAWQGGDGRHSDFAKHGVANVRVFQNPEKQQQVSLLIDVADMEAFHAYLNSEDGAKAKAEDGVIDKGMRVYQEVK